MTSQNFVVPGHPCSNIDLHKVNWSSFYKYLDLIKRSSGPLVIVAFPPEKGEKVRQWETSYDAIPEKEIDQFLQKNPEDSLGVVVNPARPKPEGFGSIPSEQNDYGKSKKWGASDAHIRSCSFLWLDPDGGLNSSQTLELVSAAGLPTPSFIIFTGGKSYHCYWRLVEELEKEKWKSIMKRLFKTIHKINNQAKIDSSVGSPCQVMRAAGGIHPKTGHYSEIQNETDNTYSIEQIEDLLDPLDSKVTGSTGSIWRPDEEKPLPGEQFPEVPLPTAIPLEIALRKKTVDLIRQGQHQGEKVGRPLHYNFISKSAQIAELCLQEWGQPYTGSAKELCDEFARNSDLDIELAYSKHWAKNDLGDSDLSKLSLKRKLRSYAREHCSWKEELQWGRRIKNTSLNWNELTGFGPEDWCLTQNHTVETIVQEAYAAREEKSHAPLRRYSGRFLRYDPARGFYEHKKDADLKKEIADLLPLIFTRNGQKVSRKLCTSSNVTNAFKWLATVVASSEMESAPAIAFSNGTYLINKNKLVEHSSDYKLNYSIQGDYTPEAQCPPNFKKFVESSFGSAWLEIIRHVIRYMADSTFRPTKLIVIIGPSGSGKGVLERVIEKMFPPSCISVLHSGFSEIKGAEKYNQYIAGKRLIAWPDIQGLQRDVTPLYSLVDGGLATGRVLFGSEAEDAQAFNGRVVICSTAPPRMDDAGGGFTRRGLILKTTPPIERKADPALNEKLKNELGLIVSWALQADRESVENTLSGNVDLLRQVQLQAETEMDPIRAFIEQCFEPAAGDVIVDHQDLYADYKIFCEGLGAKAHRNTQLFESIKNILPQLHVPRRSVEGTNSSVKSPWTFYGFKIRKRTGIFSSSSKLLYKDGGLTELKNHHPDEPSARAVHEAKNGETSKEDKPIS